MAWWDCYIWIDPTLKCNFNISQSFCFWVGCCIHLCKMHLFETVSKTDTSCIYCVQSCRSISEKVAIIRSLGIDKRQFLHKMEEVGAWEIRNGSANKNSVWQGSRRERNTIKFTIPLISECSLCLVDKVMDPNPKPKVLDWRFGSSSSVPPLEDSRAAIWIEWFSPASACYMAMVDGHCS
jgi:hypothetical protein